VAALEADVELGVGAHRELADRARLDQVEAGLGKVDRAAQDRERQREHDAVGGDRLRGRALLEGQRVAPTGGQGDADQLRAHRDLALERCGHRLRDLVVAAAHVELLVRGAEQPQLALAGVAEQVEEVERALLVALGAELDVVRDVEQLPEARRGAAGHALLDPLGDRHRVEHPPALGRGRVGRRVRGGRDVLVELLVDAVEVLGGLRERVWPPVEVVQRLGAVRLALQQVVEREPELLGELAELDVPRVDQLAAVLGHEPGRERAADRPAAAAQAVARLVQLRADTRLFEAIGTRQAGEPAADDDDTGAGGGPCFGGPRRHGDGGGAGGAEELTTAQRELLHARGERGTCHGATLRPGEFDVKANHGPPRVVRQGAVKPRISCVANSGTSSWAPWPTPSSSTQSAWGNMRR
jgi:hypothetical protein